MPQQYHSVPDAMYADYRQPSSSYQDNYQMMYTHSNFQHYRSSVTSPAANEFGYDYGQQYYPSLQSTNSYGMLSGFNGNSNAFSSNFHTTPYTTGLHATPFTSYENLSISPSNPPPLNVKTDVEPEQSASAGSNLIRNGPIESSNRSESSFTSKLDVCPKSGDTLTELSGSVANSDQSQLDTMYQSCNEENVSSE